MLKERSKLCANSKYFDSSILIMKPTKTTETASTNLYQYKYQTRKPYTINSTKCPVMSTSFFGRSQSATYLMLILFHLSLTQVQCQQQQQQHNHRFDEEIAINKNQALTRAKRWSTTGQSDEGVEISGNLSQEQSPSTNRQEPWRSSQIPAANPNFEAAFQGECGKNNNSNPCEHICLDLHDGTYECSCFYGFTLAVDGYSCASAQAETTPTSWVAPSTPQSLEKKIPAAIESSTSGVRTATTANNKSNLSNKNKMRIPNEDLLYETSPLVEEKSSTILEKPKRRNKVSAKKISDQLSQNTGTNENGKFVVERQGANLRRQEREEEGATAVRRSSSKSGSIETDKSTSTPHRNQVAEGHSPNEIQEKRVRQRRLLMLDASAAPVNSRMQKVGGAEASWYAGNMTRLAKQSRIYQNLHPPDRRSSNEAATTNNPLKDSMMSFSFTTTANSVDVQNANVEKASPPDEASEAPPNRRNENGRRTLSEHGLSNTNSAANKGKKHHLVSYELSDTTKKPPEGARPDSGNENNVDDLHLKPNHFEPEDEKSLVFELEDEQNSADGIDSDVREMMMSNDKLVAKLEESILSPDSKDTEPAIDQGESRLVQGEGKKEAESESQSESGSGSESESGYERVKWDYYLSQLEELVRKSSAASAVVPVRMTFEDYAALGGRKTNEIEAPTKATKAKLAGDSLAQGGGENDEEKEKEDDKVMNELGVKHETNEATTFSRMRKLAWSSKKNQSSTSEDSNQRSELNDVELQAKDEEGEKEEEEEEEEEEKEEEEEEDDDQNARLDTSKQSHEQDDDDEKQFVAGTRTAGNDNHIALEKLPCANDDKLSASNGAGGQLFSLPCNKKLSQECESGGECVVEFFAISKVDEIRATSEYKSKARCRCPIGRGGGLCQKPVQRTIPKFLGHSYLALPMVLDGSLSQMRILFKPQVPKRLLEKQQHRPSLLLYSLRKFVLLLNDDMRRIELKYLNPNSKQLTRVIGSRDVDLNRWNELIVTDDASNIDLNRQNNNNNNNNDNNIHSHYHNYNAINQKQSGGELEEDLNRIVLITPDRILLREEELLDGNVVDYNINNNVTELFVAGLPDSINSRMVINNSDKQTTSKHFNYLADDKSITGFTGCIKELRINEREYNFRSDLNGDTLDGFDIVECCG